MQYNVAQLLKEPIGSFRSYQFEDTLPGTKRITDSIEGLVRIVRTHQGVLVNADLKIETLLACSRCLGEFTWPSTLHLEEEFYPVVDLRTGHRMSPPQEEEGALLIDVEHVLDLSEVTRQYAIANLPMKPLCRPDCMGLCRLCGTNLNQENCDCSIIQGVPRWGALSALLHLQEG